MLNSP
jgi:Peroxidase, family 2